MWVDAFVPGYQVSDDGQVRSASGRVLSQWQQRGRMHVQAAGRPYPVHLLVLVAFSGPRESGAFPLWINGDHLDNRSVNLKWRLHDVPGERPKRCRNNHPYPPGVRVCGPCAEGAGPALELPEVL